MAEPQIRYCTTSDGVSIAYYAMGEGETLLIASNVLWSNVRVCPVYLPEYQRLGSGIGRGVRVVRYDGRGSGMSDRSALDFSLGARLRDLDAVVAKAAPPSFALLGMYHGALSAVAYAAAHPEKVTRLILSLPIIDVKAYLEHTRRWDSLREMAAEEWEGYTMTMAAATIGYDNPEILQELARRLRESMDPPAVQAYFESLRQIDVSPDLQRLQMPTLVVFPEDATRVPTADQVRAVAAGIPGSQLFTTQTEAGEYWPRDAIDAVERFLGLAPDSPAARPEHPSDRRQASAGLQTILFTDIEANTELLQRVGDAAWRDILREHERTTRAILAEHGGAEIKTIGDAFMTAFGSASAALECAIALQRAFAPPEGTQPGAAVPHQLRIRIGVNAGEPIAEAGDLFGTSVTMASRIQSLAKGGEVLVSDVVRQLVAGKGFLFEDRGEHVLRGFEDPVRVFALRVG